MLLLGLISLACPETNSALQFAERTANDRAGYLTLERVALLKPPAGGRDGLAYGSLSGGSSRQTDRKVCYAYGEADTS
jgi:hypothetical protein